MWIHWKKKYNFQRGIGRILLGDKSSRDIYVPCPTLYVRCNAEARMLVHIDIACVLAAKRYACEIWRSRGSNHEITVSCYVKLCSLVDKRLPIPSRQDEVAVPSKCLWTPDHKHHISDKVSSSTAKATLRRLLLLIAEHWATELSPLQILVKVSKTFPLAAERKSCINAPTLE